MSTTTNVEGKKGQVFLLDSGASDHIVCELDWLYNARKLTTQRIVLGDGHRLGAIHRGDLRLKTRVAYNDESYTRTLTLADVLFVPGLTDGPYITFLFV